MKKQLLILSFLIGIGSAYSQNVNIPDANFKACLLGNTFINTNGDTEIQVSEAAAYNNQLNCQSLNITDLTGIEAFTSMTGLQCEDNLLTSLDVSACSSLIALYCHTNQLTSLNFSPTVRELACSNNQLTSIDVSANTDLYILFCNNNQLTSLNVANGNNQIMWTNGFNTTGNTALTCIEVDDSYFSLVNWVYIDSWTSYSNDCSGSFGCTVTIPDANFKSYLVGNGAINTNMDTEIQCTEAVAFAGGINCNNMSITDLTGIEAFINLTTLECNYNPIGSLDLSSNSALTVLYCNSTSLTSLTLPSGTNFTNLIAQNNSLTSSNFSSVPNLSYLHIGGNLFTSLDISSNLALTSLYCNDNLLTSIDISSNTNLIVVNVLGNVISSLNLSNNLALTNLDCSWNNLTALNISSNSNLSTLRCYNNTNLTSLDLSNNNALTVLQCQDNLLATLNVANGNNTAITTFNATGNSNLTCIEVDDVTYSTTNWTNIDATASFSEDCGGGLAIDEINTISLNIYPNPASTTLAIETEATIESIQILNVNGATVQREITNNFSVESLTSGVYLISVKTANGVITKRFIKE